MARKRDIDPSFWQSDTVRRLTREQRLFFLGLISNADDEGWIKGSGEYLKAVIFPYDRDVSASLLQRWSGILQKHEHIKVHGKGGVLAIEIVNWTKFQYVDRPTPSKLKPAYESAEGGRGIGRGVTEPVAETSPLPRASSPSLSILEERVEKRREGERERELSGGDYKSFSIRYATATSAHPGRQKKNTEQYAKLCSRFGETAVLDALDTWAAGRGGPRALKTNSWAAKDFLFKEGPELLEGLAQSGDNEESDIPKLQVHE